LDERLLVFTGSVDAIGPIRFDLVLANLLRTELLPILAPITALMRRNGLAIFSGLLECEREEMAHSLARVGLQIEATRTELDAAGDCWLSLLTRREPPRASRLASA
jgi:ribosomal protein L11 methylase PrmA